MASCIEQYEICDIKEGWGIGQVQQRGYEDRYQVKQFGPFRYFAVFDGHAEGN